MTDLSLSTDDLISHAELYRLADRILTRALERCKSDSLVLEFKTKNDAVTDLDLDLQALIFEELKTIDLEASCVSEEMLEVRDVSERAWLVDPLDGTSNFIQGLPMTAISVALVEGASIYLSFVINLTTGDIYSARRGEGFWLNGGPVSTSRPVIRLIGGSTGYIKEKGFSIDGSNLRILGSQAMHLCYTAQGALSGSVSKEAKAWDDVAGALMVRESGGSYRNDFMEENWLSLALRGASLNSRATSGGLESVDRELIERM